MIKDFHTHNLMAEPGSAIVNLPIEALLAPSHFHLRPGGLYSVGIHPWWTTSDLFPLWGGFEYWSRHSQVITIGECGLDKIQGADLIVQEAVFVRQLMVAEQLRLPVTIHCVKAFDRLLALKKRYAPTVKWTIHGFRGNPRLAKQLLDAGLDLSFGLRYNAESWAITPPERRYRETDDAVVEDGCEDHRNTML